jgi:hypothetical protein
MSATRRSPTVEPRVTRPVSKSRKPLRPSAFVVILLAGSLMLGGCGSGGGDEPPVEQSTGTSVPATVGTSVPTTAGASVPARAADCNHLLRGGDPGIVAGFHWTGEKHAYAEPATVYVCFDPRYTGSVTLEPLPDGVAASPERQPTLGAGNGVLPFVVTVQPGSTGRLRMALTDEQGAVRADIGGPKIGAQDDGWRFEEAG